MPYSVNDITDLIKTKEFELDALFSQLESDYGLWSGEPYVPDDGYESFTDNTPQLQADKSIALLAEAKRDLRILIIDPDKKAKRTKKSQTERFVDGYIDAANTVLSDRGEHDIQSQMAWQAYVRGMIIFIPLIYKDKGGNTVVDCIFWDRIWTRYEMGGRGVEWAAYVQYLKPTTIYQKWGYKVREKGDDTPLKCVEFYCDKWHTRLVDDVLKHRKEHDVGFNPVVISPCGFAPLVTPRDERRPTYENFGETGFKNIRNTVGPNNMIKAAYVTQAKRYRKPPWKAYSEDGDFTLDGDPGKSGAYIPLSKRKGQDLVPIDYPEMPKESALVAQMLDNQLHEAGLQFPYTGMTGERTQPGITLNISAHATHTSLAGMKKAIQIAFEKLAWNITRQFSSHEKESNLGLKPIELMFKSEEGMEVHDFRPDEIKPFRFKCEITYAIPKDEMTQWMQARIAREPNAQGDPLMDDQTINEKILKDYVKDSDAVRTRKSAEWVTAIPVVKLRTALFAFLERADDGDEDARTVAMAILAELMLMEQKQKNELMGSIGQGMNAMMGGMQPQPMQGPMQGMNNAAGMPMGGMEGGIVPPMAMQPGVMMSPEQEIMMRMSALGLTPGR